MEVMKAILSRRSRKQFIDKPIPFEVLVEILNAGNHAPSAGNLQNWKFFVITNKELRKELPLMCSNQECAFAPISIIVLSEPAICKEYFGNRAEFYSTQNCAAAVQNMLIAANNYGLGAVWLGAFDEERIKIKFDINEECKIEAIISLGYSQEIPKSKNFKDLRDQVYFNSWENNLSTIYVENKDYSGFFEDFAMRARSKLSKSMDFVKEKFRKK